LWILDEPFTAIDLDGVALVESLVADHAAGGGAVLLTTHHKLSLLRDFRQVSLVAEMSA
jgi:heme exporter protein A